MKIFSGNENISSVWLHFKKCFEKYFLVFGCILKNIIKNTFSTCCSHFLKFSQLPNKYIALTQPKIKIKTFFIHKLVKSRKRENEGKRENKGKRWSESMEDSGGQIGWVWGWSGVGWWSVVARSAIGGGGQIGCQDRYQAWGFGRWDRWFDLEVATTAGMGGGWWVVDRWHAIPLSSGALSLSLSLSLFGLLS